MKSQTTFFLAVCIICFLFYRCSDPSVKTSANDDSATSNTNMYEGYASQAELGKHLVAIGGCGDCPTPKK